MSIAINTANAAPVSPAAPANRSLQADPAQAGRGNDIVEFSARARSLSRAAEHSSLSLARTRAIREQIENGTFETPERINGTVDRLLDVIA